jgi:hypothetical protein
LTQSHNQSPGGPQKKKKAFVADSFQVEVPVMIVY